MGRQIVDDGQLDVMLRDSAPALRADGALTSDNDRILRELRNRRRRQFRHWTAGLGVSVLLVGGGSAAMAGAGLETPWGWVADNVFSIPQADGSVCFQGMRIDFRDVEPDAPIVVDARDILRSIDIGALDTTQTEKDLAWEATRSRDNPDPLTPAELKQSAIGTLVAQMLFDELAARGHDVDASPITMVTETTVAPSDGRQHRRFTFRDLHTGQRS